MSEPSGIPVLVYEPETAAIEDYRIVFGSGHEEPGVFDGLGAAFEAELYRSVYAGGGFPEVDLTVVSEGRDALEAVGRALERGHLFQAAFIDLGQPPGNWGLGVAAGIRDLDPDLPIVLTATGCDLGPAELCARIPPADRLSLLCKPLHAFEIQQQVLAAEARRQADQGARLSESGSRSSDARAGNEPGWRSVSSAELTRLLSLLQAALDSLLDDPPANPGGDSAQELGQTSPLKRQPEWPETSLAEKIASLDPKGRSSCMGNKPTANPECKRRSEPGRGPESTLDC